MKIKISDFKVNVASGVFATAVSAVLQIILAPIMLMTLGVEQYGIWATLSIIMIVGSISDQGLGDTLTRSIARAWERQSFLEIKEYLTASLIIVAIISTLTVSIIFYINEDIVQGLRISDEYAVLAIGVINSLALILVLYLYQIVLNSLIIGIGLIRFKNYIYVMARIVQFIFTVIFLYAGFGIWSLVYSQSIFQILSIVLTITISNKVNKHKLTIFSVVLPSSVVFIRMKSIVKIGSPLFLSKILMMGLQPLLRVVLAREFGVSTVAYFDIANKIVRVLRVSFLSAAKAVLPVAAQSDIKGLRGLNSIKSLNSKFLWVSALIGGIMTMLVFFLGEFILRLWLFEQYNDLILSYMKIIMVSLLLNVTILSHYNTLIGWGYTRAAVLAAFFSVVTFIIGILINQFIDYSYGVEGILFAYVANYLVGGLYVYIAYMAKLKELSSKFKIYN